MIKPKYKCNKKRKIENVTVENNEIKKHKNYSQQQWICYCKIQHQHQIVSNIGQSTLPENDLQSKHGQVCLDEEI